MKRATANYLVSRSIERNNFKIFNRFLDKKIELTQLNLDNLAEKIRHSIQKANGSFSEQYFDPLSEYHRTKSRLDEAILYFFLFADQQNSQAMIDSLIENPNIVSLGLINHIFSNLQNQNHQIGTSQELKNSSDSLKLFEVPRILIRQEWLDKLKGFELKAKTQNKTLGYANAEFAKQARLAMVLHSSTERQQEDKISDHSLATQRYVTLLKNGAITQFDQFNYSTNMTHHEYLIMLDIKEMYPHWDIDLCHILIDLRSRVFDELTRLRNDSDLLALIEDPNSKRFANSYIGDMYPFICELDKEIKSKYQRHIKYNPRIAQLLETSDQQEKYLVSSDSPISDLMSRILNYREFITFFPQYSAIRKHIDDLCSSDNSEAYKDTLLKNGLHFYGLGQIEIGDLFINKFTKNRTTSLTQDTFETLLFGESPVALYALNKIVRETYDLRRNGKAQLQILSKQIDALIELSFNDSNALSLLEALKNADLITLTIEQEARFLPAPDADMQTFERLFPLHFVDPSNL